MSPEALRALETLKVNELIEALIQRGGTVTITIPPAPVEVSHDPTPSEFAPKVKYRSPEWYGIRDRLVGSLHPASQCLGCNEDDRGFVVVQGCPVHDPKKVSP